MSVQHLTIDDTTTWFQAGDRNVFIGDVLDLATSATLRVRFSRYGRGASHEWMVTADEALIVTKGRSPFGLRPACRPPRPAKSFRSRRAPVLCFGVRRIPPK